MIIESVEEFKTFLDYWMKEPSIVVPIWCDHELHPMMNELSFLYVRFYNQETDDGDVVMDFIIPYNHNDCKNNDYMVLADSPQTKFVWNKKGLLQTNLSLSNMIDLHSHFYFNENQHIDLNEKLEPLTNFYTRNGLRDNLGKSIPIMKYKEVLRSFTTPFERCLRTSTSISDTWVSSELIPVLSQIEQKGINVDTEKFFVRWSAHHKFVENPPCKVYTEYNPYTPTTRPSNRHGGINFGALNKKDGTRECFVPSWQRIFLQLDYDAYHVRIIAKLINFEIPHKSGHQWLADMYGCSYDESKGRTFKIIYGGVSDEDREIPFFAKVDDYIQNLWKQGERDGYITTPKGRKIFLKWVDDVNPQKLFNYLLQSTETELNTDIIKKLFENDIKNLVLYQYDSFLFDYDKSGTKGVAQALKIKRIVESNGFPVKASWGNDYSKV